MVPRSRTNVTRPSSAPSCDPGVSRTCSGRTDSVTRAPGEAAGILVTANGWPPTRTMPCSTTSASKKLVWPMKPATNRLTGAR